jgi:diguanylate cyclase (GGDEF)-like protein
MLRPTEVIGRIGGEEFAVVIPGVSIEAAVVRADRIRAAFAAACRVAAGFPVNATVSGGVATIDKANDSLSALLEVADKALYRAKAAGRNRIERAHLLPEANVIRVA